MACLSSADAEGSCPPCPIDQWYATSKPRPPTLRNASVTVIVHVPVHHRINSIHNTLAMPGVCSTTLGSKAASEYNKATSLPIRLEALAILNLEANANALRL